MYYITRGKQKNYAFNYVIYGVPPLNKLRTFDRVEFNKLLEEF